MKRLFAIMLAMVFAFVFAACSGTTMSSEISDEKTMQITCDKSDPDDFTLSGTLVLDENEKISYEHQLESGEVEINFIPVEEDQDIDSMPETDVEADPDPAKNLKLSEYGGGESYFEAGSYMVRVTVVGKKKATGTISIRVIPKDEEVIS